MAGTMFVVCVPTKEYEAVASNLPSESSRRRFSSEGLKTVASDGNLITDTKDPNQLTTPVICRSKSEESLSTRKRREGVHKREMFIGPWRVDTTGLPTRSGAYKSNLPPRYGVSRSTPDKLHAEGPALPTETPLLRTETPLLRAETPAPRSAKRHVFMEMQLERVLQKLNVNNAVWCLGRSGKYYQVLFSVESGAPCEEALKLLGERGIGVLFDSVVSVIPCALYYQGSEKSVSSSVEDLRSSSHRHKEEEEKRAVPPGPGRWTQQTQAPPPPGQTGPRVRAEPRAEPGAWERFVQSVRARLTVAQVVEGVRRNASFTFDFLLLLIVAALVAALGLLESSTVILVASMLISPLMGPVMAATFGTTIRDRDLQRMGLVNEFAGLLLCLAIGFLLGLMVGFLGRSWPTEEMLDRGQLRSLWVNVLIALLSGAGISIALLRDNTGSLVGVAISASLLPPAVNAGLLWAMSLVYAVSENGHGLDSEEALTMTSYYSENPAVELAVLGGISLCLTIINIVFIFLTGILMLKVKEVAPHSQSQHFWRHDVKIARDYNITLYGASAAEMLRSVVQQDQSSSAEVGPCHKKRPSPELDRLLRMSEFADHHDVNHLMCPLSQLTWSPSTLYCSKPETVRELKDLYQTIRMQQQNCLRRYSINESTPFFQLGGSGGYLPLGRHRPCALPQALRSPPYQDMLDPVLDTTLDTSLYLTPRTEDPSTSSGGKRTVLSFNNETDHTDDRRPAKKRRFVVTKADDSELLIPTP